MPDFQFQGTPFTQAIDALRSKSTVPTERYDQWMGAANAKGFVVAGATKIDLLKDIQNSLVDALENGETLADFRKKFRETVTRHGWSYNGDEGWRTGVIYNTNMRTARMAGRWQQIQARKKSFPYLVYLTVGDERVRANHRIWHQIALPVDDPWWDTFYPPNDWGCRCYVISANARTLQRMGIEVADPPQSNSTERVIPGTGEVYGLVPDGIGTGWEYNVGKAWVGPDTAYGKKLASLPYELIQAAHTSSLEIISAQGDMWRLWVDDLITSPQPQGRIATIGWVDQDLHEHLVKTHQELDTLAIIASDHQLQSLSTDTLKNLPDLVGLRKAVLKNKATDNFVFVLETDEAAANGLQVIEVNLKSNADSVTTVEAVKTIQQEELKQTANYELLLGTLD